MKKIASMNKNEILSTLQKVAKLQSTLLNKLAQDSGADDLKQKPHAGHKGVSLADIKARVKNFKANGMWYQTSSEFEDMADGGDGGDSGDGESVRVKYYPGWKDADFQNVIRRMERDEGDDEGDDEDDE